MIQEEDLKKFNNELGIRHEFGEVLNVQDYEEHEASECSDSDTGSDTSYSSDEVHDTRSYYIGYYRGPKRRKDDSDDSDELEEYL